MVPKIASPLLFATNASEGKWKPQRHLAYIDRKITDAIAGRGSKRLIVTLGPRHGKSEFISKWFPAWHVGMYPNKRVMLASYESDFAASWGRKARGILEEFGHWFGVQVDPASRAANRWGLLGYTGGMQTAGAGAALTGSGADCVAEGSVVETLDGPKPIEEVRVGDRVLGRLPSGRKVWRSVLATREVGEREVVELSTETKRGVALTPDHRVSSDGWWVAAGNVSGKTVGTLSGEESASVRDAGIARVYDIQVEECENFYANGVLVHNCLIIDDPIKNSEESFSETIRNKIWDWWLSTAYSRLEPGGIAIVLHTRWHEDDLIGRLIQEMGSGGEQWEVINFPAIAEEHDVLGRAPGEALWPERYGVADLERIKNTVGPYWWSSLYQQRPAPLEGGMFKREWFKVVEGHSRITKKCRFWDLAATDGGGDWTSGALIGLDEDENYIILDVVRGQWEPHKRDAVILQTAASDGKETLIRAEQEPGAAGVAQIDALTRKLTGYRFKGERASGDKVVRADAAASQSGIGRVKILRGEWNRAFLDELAMFPNGKHDDQVDSFSGAFNALIRPTTTFMVA